MCPFRRVDAEQAGAAALGILVPPSRRTVLILRPRSLVWDLVLAHSSGSFREMNREEGEHLAQEVAAALEASAGGRLEPVYSLDRGVSWLRVRIGTYALIVCARLPGQPYKPHLFADAASLRAASELLTALLSPPPHIEQELYLNTRNFTRPG